MSRVEMITRSELYEAVWTHPMRDIAKALGVKSGVIARICKRYDIPTPRPGHWQRVRSGENAARPVLPTTERLAEDAAIMFPNAGGSAPKIAVRLGGVGSRRAIRTGAERAPFSIVERMGTHARNTVPGMRSDEVITIDVEKALSSPPYRLSPRELQILRHLFDDETSKQIGLAEGISPRTVEVHRARILTKTRTHGPITLVKLVIALAHSSAAGGQATAKSGTN